MKIFIAIAARVAFLALAFLGLSWWAARSVDERVQAFFAAPQVPNPPSGLGAATSTITVMVGNQVVGSAPIINFLSLNGNVASCQPNPALNSIDCTNAPDTAAFLTKAADQQFTDHLANLTSNRAGLNYAGSSIPQNGGITPIGSLWVVFPDATNVANASLDLNGGGPHPLLKVSNGVVGNVTGGECLTGLPCLLIAIAQNNSPTFTGFLIH